MTRIFVYEYLCALKGGGGATPPLPDSLWREGRAMLDAVVADFRAIAGVEPIVLAAENEVRFRTLAGQADFSLIIAPEFDGILQTRCRWVEESGGRLLGPSSEGVEQAADKLGLARLWEEAGVPTPRTCLENQAPSDLLPRVLKPRFGAGSQDTYLLRSLDVAGPGAAAVLPEMIVQEYVAGASASVSFLIGPKSRVALQPCFQRLSADGRFTYLGGSLPMQRELAERAIALGSRAVQAVPGLRGYVGVDLMLGATESCDRVIEINPRLTTSYIGLRQLARFNIAELMLRVVQGQELPALIWNEAVIEFDAG